MHACRSAQRAINNIYRSLEVPATGIRLRHEYAKHAFYDTWTQVYRRLFYNPQSFDAPPQGTLANIPNVPCISRNYNHSSTFSRWQFVSIFIQFFLVGAATSRKTFLFLKEGRFGRSRSSKVDKFGVNRKRVCDFLLVRNSNFGPVLHRFGARTRFMCSWPHPYSTPILGVFPLHQIADIGRQRAHRP